MGTHLTSANFLRNDIALINKVSAMLNSNTSPTSFNNLINATSSTYATLITQLQAIAGISEINQRRYVDELVRQLAVTRAIKLPMATPGVVSGSNITTATSGGSLTNSTAYYFKFVAVDADGNLSIPSAEMTKTTGSGGAGNAHTITLKNLTQVNGAASYRIYVATTSGDFTLGYFTVTKANLEGSTGGTYTGQSLTAGTIPTGATATAKINGITDDDVAAAKADTNKTTTLIARIQAKAYDYDGTTSASVSASASAGEQWL